VALPKVEGLLTVSGGSGSGGAWRLALTETGGAGVTPVNCDVAAADYYLSTASSGLLATIQTALTGSTGAATYAVSISDDDETGTGKVTISASGGSVTAFAISWTDTAMRDALGFTGNLSGALTYTSTNASPYLWLPNCNRAGDHPDPASGQSNFGRPVRDTSVTLAPSGVHTAFFYNTRYQSRIRFPCLTGRKVWKAVESTTNESYETFWTNTVGKGRRFRYHPDRSSDSAYWTLICTNPGAVPAQEYDPAHFSSGSIHTLEFETQDYVSP
jgi:hypothetical protein